ncbi:MAG: mechanosensitive ion channel [Candidatus Paracaedibacteraceae bacterium]|nr:mechanosensitive ion channel [Candidatus Paracaedibacteraceae bacterium]
MSYIFDFLVSVGVPRFIVQYLAIAQGLILYFAMVGIVLFFWLKQLPKKWESFFQRHHLKKNVWRVFILTYIAYYIHVSKEVIPDYKYIFEHLWTIFASAAVVTSTVLSLCLVNIAVDIYETYPISKRVPIRSYNQVFKILLGMGACIIVVSIFLNKSPLAFFTGLGATIALVTVLFKDTIAGFMASVQLSSYDMVRIGDWITVPKYQADGDVLEITLSTVKIQNFDKTISMIPTAALLTDGVKNWRGMFDSKGRRIKKSIPIDMHTVRFCTSTEASNLRKKFPQLKMVRTGSVTNLTLFREYTEAYLKESTALHQEGFLFLIRELDPTDKGLPLEIYVFTKDTRWAEHEKIQADIIDHMLAALDIFGLKAFQSNTSS